MPRFRLAVVSDSPEWTKDARALARRLQATPPSPARDELLARTRLRLVEIEAHEQLDPPTSLPQSARGPVRAAVCVDASGLGRLQVPAGGASFVSSPFWLSQPRKRLGGPR